MVNKVDAVKWTCDVCKKEIFYHKKHHWESYIPEGWNVTKIKTPFYRFDKYEYCCRTCSITRSLDPNYELSGC